MTESAGLLQEGGIAASNVCLQALSSLSPPPPTFPSLSSLFFPPNREPVHRLVGKQLRGHKMTPEFCESPRQIGELNVDRDKIILFYISIMLNNTFLAPRNKMLQGRKIFLQLQGK